jgi:hypothetical protein
MGWVRISSPMLPLGCAVLVAAVSVCAMGADLPAGSSPPALPLPYFPSRVHAFVWRNWELASADRMAKVLGCEPGQVTALGRSMGLADPPTISDDQWRRSYITVIRANWHLLPYEQLLELLGWDSDKLAYTLKEDDFLYIKLGLLKPRCEPLRYSPPSEQQVARAKGISGIVAEAFGKDIAPSGEPRFAFVKQLSQTEGTAPVQALAAAGVDERLKLRYLYSYFALYGDPLAEPDIDPYPDGYLQKLAALGVNGVWMQAVLNRLAPCEDFPEFGQGWEGRLANLRKLVERARRYGISIYLYLNEPRTMDPAFFAKHPDVRGVAEGQQIAMCVSTPAVKRFLSDSLTHIFKNVPNLGGVFTITASENLTNCWSHNGGKGCERCAKRQPAEVIADTNRAIAEGVWRADPNAKAIFWDWGWHDGWAEQIITSLPKQCWFMSVSEWSLPIERGGIRSEVGEYSLSAVGPGPRAKRHWAIAQKCGMRVVAKVQVNNTWEMAAVPYVPVMEQVGRHMRNLAEAGVDGLMLSWTLGGYPSPNLEMVGQFRKTPLPSVDQAMLNVAQERFGDRCADAVVRAWKAFSAAFREYPFSGGLIYNCPVHWGPANPLYPTKTGYHATMTGIPYDDVDGWRACYPSDVMAGQFEKIATGWRQGLDALRQARDMADAAHREQLDRELIIAEAVYLHTRSVANQVRFVLARQAMAAGGSTEKAQAARQALTSIVREEMGLARRLYSLCRQDSRIGYEATNHYWYTPLDLVEKVINCRYLLDEWLGAK